MAVLIGEAQAALCSSPATRHIGGNAERGCFRLRDRGVSLGATTAADAQERTAPSSRSTAGARRGQHAADTTPWNSSEVKSFQASSS